MAEETTEDRATGHDIEAEFSLVASLLSNPLEVGRRFTPFVFPDDFLNGHFRRIWAAARSIVERGGSPDHFLIKGELERKSGEYAKEDVRHLVSAGDLNLTGSNADEYAQRVRDARQRRLILTTIADAKRDILSGAPPGPVASDAKERLEATVTTFHEAAGVSWTPASALLQEPEEDKSSHIWRDVVGPGAVTLFAGSPKAGKSTLLDAMAVAISTGQPWLDEDPKASPVPTLIVSEEGRLGLRRRMARVGAGPAAIELLPRGSRPQGMGWADLCHMTGAHANAIGAKVAIFDTLAGLAGFQGDDENKPGKALEVMQPLLDAADRYGISVIAVHHRRKSQGMGGSEKSSIDAVRGSSALTGAVDMIVGVSLTGEEDDPRRTLTFKGRFDERPALIIELEKTPVWTFRAVGSTSDLRDAELDSIILEYLAESPGWKSLREIQEGIRKNRAKILYRLGSLYKMHAVARVKAPDGRTDLYAPPDRDPILAASWGKKS